MGLFELTMINQPLPSNIIEAINKYDGENSLSLEEPKDASTILDSYHKNLALGIYGTQLIYAIEKEQYSNISSLLNQVNNLTSELGFPNLINGETMEYYNANQNNQDSLKLLAISTFEDLSSQLKNNGQIGQATLIIASGKIESIKLAVLSLETSENKSALKEKAIEEVNSLSELLLILDEFKSDENIANFLSKAKNIGSELKKDEINIKYFQNLAF